MEKGKPFGSPIPLSPQSLFFQEIKQVRGLFFESPPQHVFCPFHINCIKLSSKTDLYRKKNGGEYFLLTARVTDTKITLSTRFNITISY